jgi:hypothetical protein
MCCADPVRICLNFWHPETESAIFVIASVAKQSSFTGYRLPHCVRNNECAKVHVQLFSCCVCLYSGAHSVKAQREVTLRQKALLTSDETGANSCD